MTTPADDYLVLEAVRNGPPKYQMNFVNELKEIWRVRSLKYLETSGRQVHCDCVLYETGDYAGAKDMLDNKLAQAR